MNAIALLDLDLTLYDYDGLRRRASAAGVRAMGMTKSKRARISEVSSLLVANGDALETVGLPNFRREWSAKELFAIFAAVGEGHGSGTLCNGLERMTAAIAGLEARDVGAFRQRLARRALLESDGPGETLSRIRELVAIGGSGSLGDRAENGRLAFAAHVTDHARTYPGTARLLRHLRNEGYAMVIATEGAEGVQQQKVAALKLESRVDAVFITGECAGSERTLEALWDLAVKRIAESGDARVVDGGPLWALGVLYDELCWYASKTTVFYRKLLDTVLRPRSEWHRAFRIVGWSRSADEGVPNILVIGDRYDKDLLPAMHAYGPIDTVRVAQGKYRESWAEESLLAEKRPTATVSTMNEALEAVGRLRSLGPGHVNRPRPHPAGPARTSAIRRALAIASTECGLEAVEIASALAGLADAAIEEEGGRA